MAHRRRGRTSRAVQYGGGNVEQSNRGDCGADWSGVEGKYKGLYSKFPALFELGPKENKVEVGLKVNQFCLVISERTNTCPP